ncbi:MAG: arginine--tRNA ligase [Candidatus Yanofskybacteria bacterium]|nr:arginine--tRNA ligase [Candidatus Yanofskybacteria bacterium]
MIKRWLKNKIQEYYPDTEFDVLTPPDGKMGDYSVNLAFVLAKKNGTSPIEEGQKIVEKFKADREFSDRFRNIEFISPGFVNLKLSDDFLRDSIKDIFAMGDEFGDSDMGKGMKINLEFVSANPTGPLTVGNARVASYGDTLGNVLKKAGYVVGKEYYINDVGVQVKKLAESIRLRMLELKGEKVEFGPDLYQGEYVKDIAKDFSGRGVSEQDIMVEAIRTMTDKSKSTMEALGITFDEWFSEKKLHESGEVKEAFSELESNGYVVEEEGAKWLKMDGDQKAVLIKSDGSTTYLMNDIAYTKNKFGRGFDKAINIWGTDHHGDVFRLKAGVAALGYDTEKLEILLHQLVMLKQKNEKLKISKRAGNLVLLDDLLSDVGKDAIRFFFLTKDLNTHMEFDVELAKEQSKQNPVFYIQYAFARLSSIKEKLKVTSEKLKVDEVDLNLLKEEEELRLLRDITKFPDLMEEVAESYHVHHLAQYTLDLASDFHKFYEKHRVIIEDESLQSVRLLLSEAVRKVLAVCLGLMGLATPERM